MVTASDATAMSKRSESVDQCITAQLLASGTSPIPPGVSSRRTLVSVFSLFAPQRVPFRPSGKKRLALQTDQLTL